MSRYKFRKVSGVSGCEGVYSEVVKFLSEDLCWACLDSGSSPNCIRHGYGREYSVFFVEGITRVETIYMMVDWYDRGVAQCGVVFTLLPYYEPNVTIFTDDSYFENSTSVGTGAVVLPRSGTFTLWLWGDKDCVIGVVKVDGSRYFQFYAGAYGRYMSYEFDPLPVVLISSHGKFSYSKYWSDFGDGYAIGRAVDVVYYDDYGRLNESTGYFLHDPDNWLDHTDSCIRTAGPFVHCIESSNLFAAPFYLFSLEGDSLRGQLKHMLKLSWVGTRSPEDTVTLLGTDYIIFPSETSLNPRFFYALPYGVV